jgi:uncharacterized protein (DUF2384 family)
MFTNSIKSNHSLVRPKKVSKKSLLTSQWAAPVKWITGMIPALGGVTPLSLLDTPAGFELVIDTLGQLANSVCA